MRARVIDDGVVRELLGDLLFVGVIPMIIAFAIFSCAAPAKQVVTDVATKCAVPAVAAQVTAVLPDVEVAIQGAEVDWQAEIARLEAGGIDLAVCAVEAAVADLTARAGKAESAAEHPAIDLGIARGRAYLAAKGVK